MPVLKCAIALFFLTEGIEVMREGILIRNNSLPNKAKVNHIGLLI